MPEEFLPHVLGGLAGHLRADLPHQRSDGVLGVQLGVAVRDGEGAFQSPACKRFPSHGKSMPAKGNEMATLRSTPCHDSEQ